MKCNGIVKVESGVSSVAALDLVACCSLFVLKVQHHGQLLVSTLDKTERSIQSLNRQ